MVTKAKVEAPITDRGPIMDFIFKCHTFLRHISIKGIDKCLKLKLSGIGSSTLDAIKKLIRYGIWQSVTFPTCTFSG
jgi:hypothetical protein